MAIKSSRQKRILVVDDVATNRDLVGKILLNAKYSVEFAVDGYDALEILSRDNAFELVLLDIEMPGINGFEVCKAIRKDIKIKELPVIFLTSFNKIENKVFGFGAGAHDYVTKPFNAEELLARINTQIQLKHKSDIIKEMNATLQEKNKNITDSINYAQYIQKALFPVLDEYNDTLQNYFILHRPKDIISGDFYWFKKHGDMMYITVADCTGHGVPGAFMSVLGISMLNEIIRDQNFYPPNYVLNELRRKIIKSLHQGDSPFENKDGMDMAVCLINFKNLSLQYSGAHIPFYLIRKNKSNGAFDLIKRVPDRMPVGNHPLANNSFTNHFLGLEEGDRIYLFTDGFISQFGGGSNKTFRMARFRNLLMDIQIYPMNEQIKILEQTYQSWRGSNEQADDILIIGLEVNETSEIKSQKSLCPEFSERSI